MFGTTVYHLLIAVALVAPSLAVVNFKDVERYPRSENSGKTWAVIVSGERGWQNYRHQADACHAYQILHAHGIPDERIVVMMYDDVAYSPENPTPGILLNHPNGSDVYQGVLKDYIRKDVTSDNFLNILQGNTAAMNGIGSMKVINSGPDDSVFVYLSNLGAPGLLTFPSDVLHAQRLMNVIKAMYAQQKYKQLVFYVDSSESASLFETLLPKDVNVYAVTAASSIDQSLACYYDKSRKTFLGDVFSVSWMEDSDKESLRKESLNQQYDIVRGRSDTRQVQRFGDLSIGTETVAVFQGNNIVENAFKLPRAEFDAVHAVDVPKEIFHRRLSQESGKKERMAIKAEMGNAEEIKERVYKRIKALVSMCVQDDHAMMRKIFLERRPLRKYTCYERAVNQFNQHCFNLPQNEYALRQLYILVNLCEINTPIATIEQSMAKLCNSS